MAWASVQGKTNGNSAGGNTLTLTWTTANITVGNGIILFIHTRSTVTSVVDSAGNTFTQRKVEAGSGCNLYLYTAPITAGGGTKPTITITTAGSAFITAAVEEFSGLDASLAMDVTAVSNHNGSVATSMTVGPTAAASASNLLCVGGASLDGGQEITHDAALTEVQYATHAAFGLPVSLGVKNSTASATFSFTTTVPANDFLLGIGAIFSLSGGGPTAPAAPTTAVGVPDDSQVALSWTDGSDGGSAITGHDVDWSTDGVSWLGPVSTGSTSTAYTKTGLTNGTPYYFRIRAVNAVGNGAWSSTIGPYVPFLGPFILRGSGASGLTYASLSPMVADSPDFLPANGKRVIAIVNFNGIQAGSGAATVTITDTWGGSGGTSWTRRSSCARAGAGAGSYNEQIEIWERVTGTGMSSGHVHTAVNDGDTASADAYVRVTAIEMKVDSTLGGNTGATARQSAGPTSFSLDLGAGNPKPTSVIFTGIQGDNTVIVPTPPTGYTTVDSVNASGSSFDVAFRYLSGTQTFSWTSLDSGSNYLATALEVTPVADTPPLRITSPAPFAPGKDPMPRRFPLGDVTTAPIPFFQDAARITALIPTPFSPSSRQYRTPARANSVGPFPVRVASNGRYLVDKTDTPWMIHGEAAWSAVAQLTIADIDQYVYDRWLRGINAVLVSIPEHFFATHAPNNIDNVAPFQGAAYQSPPNGPYWDRAEYFVARCQSFNITCFIFPAYLGAATTDEGWNDEIVAATDPQMFQHGVYVGQRFRDYDNVVWIMGADRTPNATELSRIDQLAQGIRSVGDTHLMGSHDTRHVDGAANYGGKIWLGLNSVYTADPSAITDSATAYNEGTVRPTFLIEGKYENFTGITLAQIRREQWQTILVGGIGGHFVGNESIWSFGFNTGFSAGTYVWQNHLADSSIAHAALIRIFFDAVGAAAWSQLAPDLTDVFMTSGEGSGGTSQAAASYSTVLGVIYKPAATSTTVDTTKLSGLTTIRIRWFDPTNGSYVAVGSFAPSSTQVVAHPGANAAGDNDWVMVLDSAPAGDVAVVATASVSASATSVSSVDRALASVLGIAGESTSVLSADRSGTAPADGAASTSASLSADRSTVGTAGAAAANAVALSSDRSAVSPVDAAAESRSTASRDTAGTASAASAANSNASVSADRGITAPASEAASIVATITPQGDVAAVARVGAAMNVRATTSFEYTVGAQAAVAANQMAVVTRLQDVLAQASAAAAETVITVRAQAVFAGAQVAAEVSSTLTPTIPIQAITRGGTSAEVEALIQEAVVALVKAAVRVKAVANPVDVIPDEPGDVCISVAVPSLDLSVTVQTVELTIAVQTVDIDLSENC